MRRYNTRKNKRLYDHNKSIARSQEAFKEHYEESHNPLYLMLDFNHAVKYSIPIPQWVQERLSEVFEAYIESDDEEQSLDVLLGCIRGKGQKPVRTQNKLEWRNFDLMTAVDMLHRQGMTISDASRVVYHHFIVEKKLMDMKGDYVISYDKIRTMFSAWKSRLEKVHEYPQVWLRDVLESTPTLIRKKYPALFK